MATRDKQGNHQGASVATDFSDAVQEGTTRSNSPSVALVMDWLTTVGGAERVLKSIHDCYPDAPIYTSQYREKGIDWFKDADVRTGWLNYFPAKMRRLLGPLRQLYFNHLDLSDYDIVISVTGAEAKSVITNNPKKGTKATHFCYCHVPTQYYWGAYDQYIENPGFGPFNGLVRSIFKLIVNPLKKADYKAAQRPDYYITISQFAADQIKKYYGKDVKVINPPVSTENFHTPVENSTTKKGTVKSKKPEQPEQDSSTPGISPPGSYFINFSRQVNWKRLDLAIKACLKTHEHLVLIGTGAEHEPLVKLANGSNLITFLPQMPQSELKKHLAHAKAFIFPSEEPFGIAPVEALAAGCPTIAYGSGGALDYVKEGKNGLLFPEQTVDSLVSAIKKFNQLSQEKTPPFPVKQVQHSADFFSEPNFKRKLKAYINEKA